MCEVGIKSVLKDKAELKTEEKVLYQNYHRIHIEQILPSVVFLVKLWKVIVNYNIQH